MTNVTSRIGNRIRAWPRATLIILSCAIIAVLGGTLWFIHGHTAEAMAMPNAARVERVEGQVGLNRSTDDSANPQWIEVNANTPISVGDRVLTREQSQTRIAFTGRNFATLEADTSMDVLNLTDQKTQVALRTGSALFDIGALDNGGLFEVATPCGAVDLQQPGMYQVSINDQGEAVATTLNGQAQIVGAAGTGKIDKGEVLTVPCEAGSTASLSQVDKSQAGAVLDNYYRQRYSRVYDGRYRNYDAYLADPNFYDPYRNDLSYKYVSDDIPGVEDLDDYGSWETVGDYGYCWSPRVDVGWAPYQDGYWDTDYPFGETWVSYEPWGYAPYHYGRWVFATNRWFWIPVRTRPVYSPALVAFFSFGNDSIAWLPLGPGDPYVPRYYDREWRARYLGREEHRDHLFNQNVAGAISVVSARDFNRRIDSRILQRPDMNAFVHARSVSDPMSVATLRRAAFTTGEGRHRIDVPTAMARRIMNTNVVTTSAVRSNTPRMMRANVVSDRLRNQKLRLRDERSASAGLQPGRGINVSNARGGRSGNIAADQARERQMADLSRQAARGNRGAGSQLHVLQRQQIEARRSERLNNATTNGGRVELRNTEQSRVAHARGQVQTPHVIINRQPQIRAESGRGRSIITQQQRVLRQPRVESGRSVNRARNIRPQLERHVQNQPPRVYQPRAQQRVVRQPQLPRVQSRPQSPVTMRQQRPPKIEPVRPATRVRPPQPMMRTDRAQAPVQMRQQQPAPARVDTRHPQGQPPIASAQGGGNRRKHP